MKLENVENLVVSGGGCNAYALIGALCCIEHIACRRGIAPLLSKIKSCAGTSVGAIITLFVVCNVQPCDMIDEINKYDRNSVLRYSDPVNIWKNNGLNNNEKMVEFIQNFLYRKFGKYDLTMFELYGYTHKRFVVCVCNVTNRRCEYLDYMSTPHMSVTKAILMTVAVPIVFSPIEYNNKYYVDGGLMCNFPHAVFDDVDKTIGIRMTSGSNNGDENAYLNQFMSCLFYTMNKDNDKKMSPGMCVQTVEINPKVPFYTFWIRESVQSIIFIDGIKAVHDHVEPGRWSSILSIHRFIMTLMYVFLLFGTISKNGFQYMPEMWMFINKL